MGLWIGYAKMQDTWRESHPGKLTLGHTSPDTQKSYTNTDRTVLERFHRSTAQGLRAGLVFTDLTGTLLLFQS